MKKERGITLVALIITIIVMLILVAVSVNILIKSNLIGTAEKTANGYKAAQDREANGSLIEINGKKYASLEDYQEGKEYIASNIPGGTKVDKNTEYTIEGETRTAEIPAGFTVSGIHSERTIDGGLVIYDIPDNTTVDWTNPDSVKTKYNQFVWIPVEVNKTTEPKDTETNIKSFSRTEWAENEETGGNRTDGLNTKYTEPYNGDETNDYDGTGTGKTGIAAQITELTKSIYKYGGFWIGRYEAGVKTVTDAQGNVTETARTEESLQTDPFVVQQDKYPYNYIQWGTSMGDVSTEGAVFLCNKLYNTADYGVKSMLCTGAAWDSMLDFIKDKEHNVINSTDWGNHRDPDFIITRGKWASSDSISSFTPVEGTYKKEKNKRILLTTGAAETRNIAKNLYDVAGNCFEWTTEACSTDKRVIRGRRLQPQWLWLSSLQPPLQPSDVLPQHLFVPPFTLCNAVGLQAID